MTMTTTHDETCENPTHDHFTSESEWRNTYTDDVPFPAEAKPLDGDGEPVVPTVCHGCGEPAYYDTEADDYRHNDPDVQCFLIGAGEPIDEADVVEVLLDAINYDGDLNESMPGARAASFDDVGMMTMNKGVVITMADGSEFQLKVVQSKRADR